MGIATVETVSPVSGQSLRDAADETLAQRVHAGDDAAFEELYRRYADRLYRYCASILGSREEAEEAMQSSLFSAYRALREQRRAIQVRPWLYRIAHNRCLDTLRRRRETGELSGREETLALRPEDEVNLREDLRQLRRDLAALEPAQRSALVLREMGGLSHAEIAVALDATPTGAKQLIHEAREALYAFEAGRALACTEVRRRISDLDGRILRGRAIRSHLRSCPSCASFRAEIAARRAKLPLLFPPLSAGAARLALQEIVGTGGTAGLGALVSAGGGVGGGLLIKAAIAGIAALAGGAVIAGQLGVVGDGRSAGTLTAPASAPKAAGGTGATIPPVARPAAAVSARGGTATRPAGASAPAGGGAATPASGPAAGGVPTPASAAASAAASGGSGGPGQERGAERAGGVKAGASAGPASVNASVDPGEGGASVSVGAGPVSADVSANLRKGRVSAGVGAGPVTAAVSADVPSARASVDAQAGSAAKAGVAVDGSAGTASGTVSAGPASADVSADLPAGSAGVTVSTPAASASVSAGGSGSNGVSVSTPLGSINVPLPGAPPTP